MHEHRHVPVLLREVLHLLCPRPGERVLDCTIGLGGHAEALLRAIGPRGTLIALDADRDNLACARGTLASVPGVKEFHHANFLHLERIIRDPVDILFADLGVSSPHFDDPERGFSLRRDGPLDCRFDRSKGIPASEYIASSKEMELERIFKEYGELPRSAFLASAMHKASKNAAIMRTTDLVKIATVVYGFRSKNFLPQIFQALRIAVNNELSALSALLSEGPKRLRAGGRMGVIAYHSLEDRMVKTAFRTLTSPERDLEKGSILRPADFALITKRPVRPTSEEIALNVRARSARFRVIQRSLTASA